jgi:hypothetical protein
MPQLMVRGAIILCISRCRLLTCLTTLCSYQGAECGFMCDPVHTTQCIRKRVPLLYLTLLFYCGIVYAAGVGGQFTCQCDDACYSSDPTCATPFSCSGHGTCNGASGRVSIVYLYCMPVAISVLCFFQAVCSCAPNYDNVTFCSQVRGRIVNVVPSFCSTLSGPWRSAMRATPDPAAAAWRRP